LSLKKYSEKRHFDRTPEPAPADVPPATGGSLQYCVQRHHATHLHYDLRLEAGGALKSWAVPKGPTLDPAEKRLAMMVEDHPIEYGSFEGIIPKGNYGAGSVMLWDRGTYELLGDASAEEQLARGDFKFRLHGEKVTGEFALVRMQRGKGNEWLLLKKKDASAQPGWNTEDHAVSILTGRTQEEIARGLEKMPARKHAALPEIEAPMLAQIGRGDPPSGDSWIYEVKWDGVRAICYIQDGKVRMVSRNGNLINRQYPELSILPHHIRAQTAIVDGEIAALNERGVPSFELLQRRINVSDASAVATLARHHPVVFYAFDLLYLDGLDLRGEPLLERKRRLKEVLQQSDVIRYSEHFSDGAALLEAARQQGVEGIVGKRAASLYESRRAGDWVKYKVQSSESFILCGFTEGERDHFGALVLGIHDSNNDGGELKWAGNVGTGFDRKTMKAIYDKLVPLAVARCPLEPDKNLPKKGVTWVRPQLVCEVKFANWTEDGRLRAPVWIGFRPDIDPAEVIRQNENDPPEKRPRLLDASLPEAILAIDGHKLKFTNLNKVFYPADGYRKRDLLNYYDAVAPLILPHLKDRPLSLKRYPNGIDKPFFFQKAVATSFPKWLRTGDADGIQYVIGADRATLLFLVNLGCIDHNPWMSRMESIENPDYLLIDLDPQDCSYEKIVEAALLVRKKLDRAELESFPKTTGGDGMHIFVPLEPRYTYDQVRSLAELLATMVAHERPDLFTTPRAVSKRDKGKVYFDWMQIGAGKTISAPYAVRAYPGAPVATPLAWHEVTPRLKPEQFHIGNALARFDRVGDLFSGVLERSQRMEEAVEKLGKA
jgi:bifunctional non-homologous end joining protein LigD